MSTYSLTVRLNLHNPIPNEYSRQTKKPRHSPLIERKCHNGLYTVTINAVNIHNSFLGGEYPSKKELSDLYSLDREVLHVACSQEIVSFWRQSLFIHLKGISSLISLVGTYICPHLSGVHQFNIPYLECRHHVLDLDYLHAGWDIIDTNFLLQSLITPAHKWDSETQSMFDIKSMYKTLQYRIQSEKSNAADFLREAETQCKKLDHQKINLLGTIHREEKRLKRIRDEMESTAKNTPFQLSPTQTILAYYEMDQSKPPTSSWPSRNGSQRAKSWYWSQWYFQSCECDHSLVALQDDCFSKCDDSLNNFLNSNWFEQVTHFQYSRGVGGQEYLVTLSPFQQKQENIETKRVRYLKQKQCMSDSELFVIALEELPNFALRMADCMERCEKFHYISLASENKTSIFCNLPSYDPPCLPKIWKQFCDQTNEIGESLGSWCVSNKKHPKILDISLVMNPKLFERFMLHRKHLEDKLCLVGFHGTGETDPDIICRNGLDPRYSGTGLYLGAGVYLSASGLYCHKNNYVHYKNELDPKRTVYNVLGVLFLPGVPYREPNPNSTQSKSRRIAPDGYQSVTCVTDNTRIWCLYDSNCYPYCSISYTLENV